jgi:hypothetical protein
LGYLEFYKTFHEVSGSSIFAYSAIFSPSDLNIDIIHEWQYFDETTQIWNTESRINLLVIGGRDGGFRTFSNRENLQPGKWRVNVETETGQIIGRLRFNLIKTETEPELSTNIK